VLTLIIASIAWAPSEDIMHAHWGLGTIFLIGRCSSTIFLLALKLSMAFSTAPELVLDITQPATGAMFSSGDRMAFRVAYLN
jgi:hypothetical protein